MADKLGADPESLCDAGNAVAAHAVALLALQRRCHGDVDAARAGWVGCSARALTGLLDSWGDSARDQARRLGEQAGGLHTTAVEYARVEQINARSLRNVVAERY